jgi:predicted nucleic acid-binding protein
VTRAFFDSNVLVYAFSDGAKSGVAHRLLQTGGVVGIQSLNELANVLRRKQRRDWPSVHQALEFVRDQCGGIVLLDEVVRRDGLRLAERYVCRAMTA